MNEETTTQVVEPATDTGVEETTQPVEQVNEPAVETLDEQQETESTNEPEEPDNSNEDDLSEWATNKGIDLSTPEGQQKALKSMRESEKAFHGKSQEAADLAKQISKTPEVDPSGNQAEQALAIANSLQNQQTISNWVTAAKVTSEEIAAMRQYGQEDPQTEALLNAGLLSLDQYRAIANASTPIDTAKIEKAGGQKALETLANKQRATAVKGNAVSNSTSSGLTPDNVEQWYESLGSAGRKDPANQRLLQSILAG